MTTFLTFALLLAGANGEGNGSAFQVQLSYEPAVLLRGKDYRKHVSDFTMEMDPSIVLYSSHPLKVKIGIQTRNGFGIRAVGSIGTSLIGNPESSLRIPPDSSGYWGTSYNMVTSIEYSVGGEVGYAFRSPWEWWRQNGDIHLGVEGVWGRFYVKEDYVKWNQPGDKYGRRDTSFSFRSQVKGWQAHMGVSVPTILSNHFSIKTHCMLKGGAIKEQSIEFLDTPPGTEWKGPRTLPRWGIALGLTLNYSGGQQK